MSYWRDKGLQQARVLARRPAEWTSDEIALVRRMAARGASRTEIQRALPTEITCDCLYQRAKKLGIRLSSHRKAHRGEEVGLSSGLNSATTDTPLSKYGARHYRAAQKATPAPQPDQTVAGAQG